MPSCSYAPALLVLALNLDGIRIFKEPRCPNAGPFLSQVLFMLAEFFLLTNCPLYPECLRKLWGCGRVFVQFIITEYLFEFMLIEFWFPMEEAMAAFMSSLIDSVEQTEGLEILKPIMEIMKCESSSIVASYFLSTFCLIAVLHATKLIDVRILDCGVGPFIQDICRRVTTFFKSVSSNSCSPCDPTRQPNICVRNSQGNSRRNLLKNDHSDDSGQWTCDKRSGQLGAKKCPIFKEKSMHRVRDKHNRDPNQPECKVQLDVCDSDSDSDRHWERKSPPKTCSKCKCKNRGKKEDMCDGSDSEDQWGCGNKC